LPVESTKTLLDRVFQARYGVAAINIVNDLTLEAVLAAAEETRSPLIVQTSHLELVVGDNGIGFEPSEVRKGCFGLASMRERALIIGGELTIDSRPQDGTRVSVSVPLSTDELAIVGMKP
jgi:nitrate/nitrite-specific signal transduction histidine kinase